jgi:AcrR family transcriptional regulator
MTDKPSRTRTPRPSRAERREEILEAATRVFGSKGYHASSLVDVAEQVGITHAGVLHHFGSKDKLLLAVLEYRHRTDIERLEGKPGGLDLFKHLVNLNIERRGLVQAYAVLTGESVTDGHPAAPWVRNRFTNLRADIAQALREIVEAEAEAAAAPEAGEGAEPWTIGDAELDRAASAVIGVMDGLQVQWLLDPAAVDLVDSTVFAIEAILAAALAGARRDRPLA